MNEKEIIRAAMQRRGWTQAVLAERAGFAGQTNITGLLNNNNHGMRIDKFYKLCKGLGLRIVIQDEYNAKDEGWVLEIPEEPPKEEKQEEQQGDKQDNK